VRRITEKKRQICQAALRISMCFDLDPVSSVHDDRGPISRFRRTAQNTQKQTQTNPLSLSFLFSERWTTNGKNKPIEAILNIISGLDRFWGLILRFLNEMAVRSTNRAGNAKQTQTNPFELNHLISIAYLKKDKNKPIEPMSPEINCLPLILGVILRFLDETLVVRGELTPNAPAAPIAAEL
jgi:hypothetical protein